MSFVSTTVHAGNCKISAVINDNPPEDKYLKILQNKLGSQFASNPNDAEYLLKIYFEKELLSNSTIVAKGLIGNYTDGNYYSIKGRGLALSIPLYPGVPLGFRILSLNKLALKNLLKKVPTCEILEQHFSQK